MEKIKNLNQTRVEVIKGDASFRIFFRLFEKKVTKIAVTTKKDKYKNLIIYSAVNNFLRKNKIFAPKFFSHQYSQGVIFIEDFGNLSFYEVLNKKKNKLQTYKRLVDCLIKIQKIKPKKKN